MSLHLKALSLCVGVATSVTSLFAQNRAPQVEVQNLATSPGPIVEINPQASTIKDPDLGEIGIVARRPKPSALTFSTAQSLNFTTNAFLSRSNTVQAFFWNGCVEGNFVPYSTARFRTEVTLEQNFFRYDHVSQLDFDSETARLDARYSLTSDDTWLVAGSYAYNRLYAPRGVGDFYHYGLLDANLSHSIPLGEATRLTLAGGLYWRQGDPSIYDRVSSYGTGLLSYDLSRDVQFAAFVRPELQIYTNDPSDDARTDFNFDLGVSATWMPIQHLSLSAAAAYIGNFSSVQIRRYDVFTPAIVFGARISF